MNPVSEEVAILAAATVFGVAAVALPVAVTVGIALRLCRTRQKRQTHP